MSNPLSKTFSGWKITVAICIGLIVSAGMLYTSLSEKQFEKVSDKGTHVWVDGNNNQLVDTNNEVDFKPSTNGDYRVISFKESLGKVNWKPTAYLWFLLAVFFMVSRDLFYIIRIRLLTKNKLSWKAAIYVILIWEFASALTPGVVGGSAVAMFILNRETIPFGKATAIVIITAFMDNLFFIIMIPFVFLFINQNDLFPANENSAVLLTWWFWIGFTVIFSVCLLLYLTLFWFPSLATRFLRFIFRLPFLKRWKFIALEWGKDIEKSAYVFQREPFSFWLKVFGSTLLSWVSRYLVINAILNAFLSIGLIDNIKILGKQLVLWLFMLVSPTPGGSGVAEFAFSELLSSFSSSAVLLATMAIIWRLISYFPYLFIGSIILPAWIKRTKS